MTPLYTETVQTMPLLRPPQTVKKMLSLLPPTQSFLAKQARIRAECVGAQMMRTKTYRRDCRRATKIATAMRMASELRGAQRAAVLTTTRMMDAW